MNYKVEKSDAEWREQLSPEQYHIMREQGTERAFTGKYYHNQEAGTYNCAGCSATLFSSEQKYESGSGWPSFWAPAEPDNIGGEVDKTWFMVRNEVHCSQCGAHLGHVFDDGPQPTGLRYCINSASMDFVKADSS